MKERHRTEPSNRGQKSAGERQAAASLRRALAESERSRMQVRALLDNARAILSLQEFPETAQRIFDSCKHLIGAQAGYVALLTENGKENEVVFLDPGELPCTVDPSLPMPIRGLRAKAYRTGKVVYNNHFADSRWTQYLPEGHVRLEGVLFAPLVIAGKTAGLLGLANKPGGFTKEDTEIASAFAELAAVALNNSRLLESLEQSEEHAENLAKALTDERDALETVMENTRAHLAYLDRNFNFLLVNSTYAEGSGHTKDELIGRNHFDLFPNEENEQIFRKVRDTGGPFEILEKPFEYADQPERGLTYWDWTLTPVKDEARQVVGLVLSLMDVTERKRMEQRIAHLASFPELNPNPVVEMDLTGRVTYANPTAKRLFPDITRPGGRHPYLQGVADLVTKLRFSPNGVITREATYEGSIYEQSLYYVERPEAVRIYGVDITQRKWVEDEIKRVNKMLEEHIIARTAELEAAKKALASRSKSKKR